MDAMANEFAGEAHFIFVYTRSTHPERFPEFPGHKTLAEKVAHAKAMRDRWNTPRTILVDALDGDVHRMYGGTPNMSWIIDHTGRVAFKAGWTTVEDILPALKNTLQMRELKREPGSAPPYYIERMMWGIPSRGEGRPTARPQGDGKPTYL